MSVRAPEAKGINGNSAQALIWPRSTLGSDLRRRKISEIPVKSCRVTFILKKSPSMAGLSFSNRGLGGMMPFSRITAVVVSIPAPQRRLEGSLQMDFIKLASALAPSRCPILAFTDPLAVISLWLSIVHRNLHIKKVIGGPTFSKHPANGSHLDRIAHWSSRSCIQLC